MHRPSSMDFSSTYVPSFGDVSNMSRAELKAIVLVKSGGDKTAVPFELGELRQAAEEACVYALDVETMRTLITRGGLSYKNLNTKEGLRRRCYESMRRLRDYEIPFRPPRKTETRDTSFPVTWRKFDVTFPDASLGFSIALDKGGNLGIVKVGDNRAKDAGVKPGDALVAIQNCSFGDIVDVPSFERDVLLRLKRAPRPVKLTFQIGDGRWPPTAEPKRLSARFSTGTTTPRKEAPAATKKPEVDVRFKERGTLGFSIHLVAGRLRVLRVRETAKSPCWLACVTPGDELVTLNGRAFGVVGVDMFDDVVRQLKQTPRPMTLTFRRRDTPAPPPPTPPTKASGPQPSATPGTKAGLPKAPPPPTTSSSRTASSKQQQRQSASFVQGNKTIPPPARQSASFVQGIKTSPPKEKEKEQAAAAPKRRSARTFGGEETKAEEAPGSYTYDAVFPKELLGIALALSRSVETGKYHVAVTEVRPACVANEVEAHDRLVAINGERVAGVEDEASFAARVLTTLKKAGRPLTLTFTASSGSDEVCFSQNYASDLFDDIDANQDGLLSQVELIKALRKNQHLAQALDLPQQIRQEDGSRDKFAAVFHKLAVKDDKTITKREWCVGISKLAAETII